MADQQELDSAREAVGEFNSIDDLFSKRDEINNTEAPASTEPSESNNPNDLMDAFESLKDTDDNEDSSAALDDANDNSSDGLPSAAPKTSVDSDNSDIETVMVRGHEGRKQKLEINYSDKKAIKNAFIKAAGMRKFQAERDEAIKSFKATSEEFEALKQDFDKVEKAFEADGAKGIVELLGGTEAWQEAVSKELEHREYIANLSAEEKYQLEMQKRDEQYKRELASERQQREAFQNQIAQEKEQAEIRSLESKLQPAFDRYRFAGKLGDEATENLYDESIWIKVRGRLSEYPDEVELTQAIIDKEFRTVSNAFKKHIKVQTEKQLKKTVENKKAQTAKRARVAAKKGLSGQSTQKKILESLKGGNLTDALSLFKQQ